MIEDRRAAAQLRADEQVRLMAKVARMYHERGLRQQDIADELHLSQARVSRLLKRAGEVGIVRTMIVVPSGVHTDLEEALEQRYGLGEAVVVDADGSAADVTPALGAATASYLEATLTGGDTIGLSSWSSTLLAAAEAMRPSRTPVVDKVVQVVGGMGDPRVQLQATRLLSLLAGATGADPVLMPAPSLLGTAAARESLVADSTVRSVMDLWSELTVLLVGIGSVDPSPLLRESGNALPDAEQDALRAAGAVGDVCLRFFDASGAPVHTAVDERLVGIGVDQIRAVPRRVAVAGGTRKLAAIRAALLGRWMSVLVTDVTTARALLDEA